MTARHWAQFGEVTFVGGIRFMLRVYRIFGRGVFRLAVYPVVLVYAVRNPVAWRSSREYLARVARVARAAGGTTRDPGWWDSVRHLAAFAESILDKLRAWADDVKLADISFHGIEHIDAALDAGQGFVVMTAHFGNPEVCRALSRRRRGAQLTVLVHTKHAATFNALVAELDPQSGLNLIEVTEITPETAMRISDRIAKGHVVVIAADRVPVNGGGLVASADFLGEPAMFPVGPYVLASLLRCPVYLLFCIADGKRFDVYVDPFRTSIRVPRRDRNAYLAELVGDFAGRLGAHCSRAPLQWFNFYDFWASKPPSTDLLPGNGSN